MSETLYTRIDSPIGELLLLGDGEGLRGLYMQEGPHPLVPETGWKRAPGHFDAVATQLAEYFAGTRRAFELPIASAGSRFQRRVWRALRDIPYGETQSYGQLARRIGAPSAPRAVGRANGSNPIPIVVPCHRVVGAGGTLTGFGGGIERKRYLLELERGVAPLPLGDVEHELAPVLAGEELKQRLGERLEPVDDVLA